MGNKRNERKAAPFEVRLSMANAEAVLDVTGMIGWDCDPLAFTDKVAEAEAAGCERLRVRINSLGGYCYDGLAMGDALKNTKMATVGEVIGTAQSMAGYILQCCQVREANKNATIMIHQPSAGVCGTVDEIYTQAVYLCQLRDRMFEDMAARCGMTGAELSAEHASMKMYSAEDALARGFIDRISGTEEQAAEEPAEEPAEEEPAAASAARGVYEYSRVSMALAMLAEAPAEEDAEEEPTEEEEEKQAAEEQELFPEEDAEEPAKEEPAEEDAKEEPAEEDAAEEDAEEEEPAEEPAPEERPLTRAEVEEMLAEREAKMYAELGVPVAVLPSPVVGAPVSAKGAKRVSMAELDAMPGMVRLEMLLQDPALAAEYASHI